MTIEEAIRQLEFDQEMILFDPTTGEEIPLHMLKTGNMDNYLTYLADGMAIEALKEIKQYREIGTVEECRKAVEKQKPKTPNYEGDGYEDGYMVYDTWICPNCGEHYEVDYDDYDYCPKCGQAIDENLEEKEDE